MKIFLSYPSEQLEKAKDVYAFFRSLDAEVWFDKESLIGGQKWDRERSLAQKSADLFLLICSGEILSKSGVIQREISEALKIFNDKPVGHVFIVSLRVEEVALPPELNDYQYIDYFRPGWQLKLARSIALRYEQLKENKPTKLLDFLSRETTISEFDLKIIRQSGQNFESEADYLIYTRSGMYWDYINSEINRDVLGGLLSFTNDARSYGGVDDRRLNWSLRVEEYFAVDDLLSLRFFQWIDFGGAHPSRGGRAMNFGGLEVGQIALADLFDRNEQVFKFLKKYCELDIDRQALDGSEIPDYSLDPYCEGDFTDKWEIFSQWNFNKHGILICLSEFSGLPYVMGFFDVVIPWEFFKDKVAENYRSTKIGLFISERPD